MKLWHGQGAARTGNKALLCSYLIGLNLLCKLLQVRLRFLSFVSLALLVGVSGLLMRCLDTIGSLVT